MGQGLDHPVTPSRVVLPELRQHPSPNRSSRRGIVPHLIVLHRPAGSFDSAERTLTALREPRDDGVSAHLLLGTRHRAVQLVPWDQKAWACEAFNAASYNVEVGDEAWAGRFGNEELLADAARAVAYLCTRTGIPARWSTSPTHAPGFVRHYDLGLSGGGHSDPTTDPQVFGAFARRVHAEYVRGGFRPVWGVGELLRIDT